MSSIFNPEEFLQSAQISEANSTASIPIPVGEYPAGIQEVKIATWAKKDGSASGLKLQVFWGIEDDAVKSFLGRDKVVVRQDIMLDLTEAGGIDTGKGKNIGLGRLREAVDLNVPGQPFSFPMLPGRMAKVAIVHEPYQDTLLAQVKGVAKLA